MKRIILLALGCCLCFIINGCASFRTYSVTKERVDQDLSEGNRGYLFGQPESSEDAPRKATRQIQVFELELRPIGRGSRPASPAVGSSAMKVSKDSGQMPAIKTIVAQPSGTSKVVVMKKYTVRKGDTLERIAKRFYGTTKRWRDIYRANQKILKSTKQLYPGQIIEIPIEEIIGVK